MIIFAEDPYYCGFTARVPQYNLPQVSDHGGAGDHNDLDDDDYAGDDYDDLDDDHHHYAGNDYDDGGCGYDDDDYDDNTTDF